MNAKEELIEYVMETPENSNRQVLEGLVEGVVDESSVQPDWNQNDPTAKDYIKNRIGYYGEVVAASPKYDYEAVPGKVLWIYFYLDKSVISYYDFLKTEEIFFYYKGEKILPYSYATHGDNSYWYFHATENFPQFMLTNFDRTKASFRLESSSVDKNFTIKATDLVIKVKSNEVVPSELLPLADLDNPGTIRPPRQSLENSWDNSSRIYLEGNSSPSDAGAWLVPCQINGDYEVRTLTTDILTQTRLINNSGNTIISTAQDDSVSALGLIDEDFPVTVTHTSKSYNGNTPYFKYLITTFSGKKGTFQIYASTKKISDIVWRANSGQSEFVMTLTRNDDNYSCDKTPAEIKAAVEKNQNNCNLYKIILWGQNYYVKNITYNSDYSKITFRAQIIPDFHFTPFGDNSQFGTLDGFSCSQLDISLNGEELSVNSLEGDNMFLPYYFSPIYKDGESYSIRFNGFLESLTYFPIQDSNFLISLIGEEGGYYFIESASLLLNPEWPLIVYFSGVSNGIYRRFKVVETAIENSDGYVEYIDSITLDKEISLDKEPSPILPSSTPGSTKKFKITVDDSGTVSAEEVTEGE